MTIEEIDRHFDKYYRGEINIPERFYDYIVWPKSKPFDHKANVGFFKSRNKPSSLLRFFKLEDIVNEAAANSQ